MAIKKCSHIFYFRFLPKEELTVWSSTTFRVPQFLRRLRQRQRQESIIDTFWLQFSGLLCSQLRSLCCEFCSRQLRPCPCIHVRKWSRRIVYLPLLPASAQWILCTRRKESLNPITNYRLLIAPLIKTSRDWTEKSHSYTPASPRLRQGFICSLLYLKRKWTMN